MKVDIRSNEVFYKIQWSKIIPYEKYSASRILPELPGIICILKNRRPDPEPLIFFECWRDGLRDGLRIFMDPNRKKFSDILERIRELELMYMYTIIDTTPRDIQDILFFLINTYKPPFNNTSTFKDSGRFRGINVKELFTVS